jgi:hypothetical protein
MTAGTAPAVVVEDETQLLAGLVPLAGARVLDLGCGAAEFSRRSTPSTSPRRPFPVSRSARAARRTFHFRLAPSTSC